MLKAENQKPKIAVLGDVILDEYVFGVVKRISPEADVPILEVIKKEYKPGGAGNVAANLAALGAEVDLFGVVGKDINAEILKKELQKRNVKAYFVEDQTRPTTLKTRNIGLNHQLLRVDTETTEPLHNGYMKFIKENFKKYAAIIVSDYAKGFIMKDLMDYLKTQNTHIFIDPKNRNKDLYHDTFFITPNIKEVREMTHIDDDLYAAENLSKTMNTNVLLTRSEEGIALITRTAKSPVLYNAEKRDIIDVTGAGDTVISSFVYFITIGKTMEESARLANKAAGISVQKIGCYQPTIEEIMRD